MKKYLFCLLAIISFIGLLPNDAKAEDVWQMAQSENYGRKAGGMLGRGLVNVATSFVDVIVHTVEGTKEGVPFVGTLTGLGSGIGCTALRVSSGALDVVTFWVPGFNGIPVGRSYSNCLDMGDQNSAGYGNSMPTAPMTEPIAAAPREENSPAHNPYDYVKK